MPAVASRGRGRRTINEINMVPFIDVMLVLLIIFMVTAPLITPGSINVPSAGKSSKAPENALTIGIDKDGALSIRSGKAGSATAFESEAAVIAAVRQAVADEPHLPVMIAADSDLRYQQVMSIMKQVRELGVERVGLAVK